MKKKTTTGRAAGKRWHLHCENSSKLGEVFAITGERVRAALKRHPKLKGKLKVTLGQDNDIYDKAVRTADFMFGWHFDRKDLKRRGFRFIGSTIGMRIGR